MFRTCSRHLCFPSAVALNGRRVSIQLAFGARSHAPELQSNSSPEEAVVMAAMVAAFSIIMAAAL